MSKRLFVAIPIQAEAQLQSQLSFLMTNLSEENITWVKEDNLHLTLKFIGKTPSNQIPKIVDAINNCINKFSSFPLVLERIGIFGSSYHARVLWVGIKENQQLQKLQECLLEGLEKVNFPFDRQNFVPHFTLGRIKKINHKDHFKRVMELAQKDFIQETKVDGFVLFESILTPEGPVYKTIKRFDFVN